MQYCKPTTSGGEDAVKEESLSVSSIKLTFCICTVGKAMVGSMDKMWP